MIALTQEKREELAKFAKATLNSLNGIEPENPNQYDGCLSEYTQKCMEIALASLTAEPVSFFGNGAYYNTANAAIKDGAEGIIPLYDAPPVPEINKDDYIGLQVSMDVSTCDDDAGHRYFGKVSALSESNGEVVLVIEGAEKNFTAPPVPEIKLPESLFKVSSSLNSQDNRYTDQPMFVVYQKKEIIGSDDHSPSRIVWLVDGEEVSETKARRLETLHQEFREVDSKYQRYAAQEVDEFVTACFTEQSCKDFLSINGHNLRRPFIVAEGSFRNHEYQAVRNWLISLNGLGE